QDAYRRAGERGHPAAAAFFGEVAEGRGELGAGQAAYRRADERGDGLGAFKLGMLSARLDDWNAAREAWRRADERGYSETKYDAAPLIVRHGAPARGRFMV